MVSVSPQMAKLRPAVAPTRTLWCHPDARAWTALSTSRFCPARVLACVWVSVFSRRSTNALLINAHCRERYGAHVY